MQRRLRTAITSLTALSLVAGQVAPASSGAITRQDYETCQTQDEASFRTAIEAITQRAFANGLVGIDYRAVVGDEWRDLGMGPMLDKQVDIAVEAVRQESSLGTLVTSIADKEKAQALAVLVAERVFRSDEMKSAIEKLAEGAGKEIGRRIELASQDAAEPALVCLKTFLGTRYGTTIAATVAGSAGEEFGLDASRGAADVSTGDVVSQQSGGITGAAILVMRRQLANMAARIGQRIAGSVLARLVSVVAGGVGLILIAKDIWDLRKGVLPIIAEEMKSKESKDKVQEELARSISEQIGEHVKDIGAKSAEHIVGVWHEFRRAHSRVLDIADRHAPFRAFLDSVRPEALGRLDEVTSLVLGREGEAGVLRRLDDGTLDTAVKSMPEAAMTIARETQSIETALSWSALAGERLADAVAFEVHRRASPADFTKASLERLLAIGDRLAVVRLASIKREARDILFEREPKELETLARAHTEGELSALAGYLTGLAKEPRDRVLAAVLADPTVLQALASDRVRGGILKSRDQAAAVDMMLRPATVTDHMAIVADFRAVWEGRIAPALLWERHPMAILAICVVALLLLVALRRLFMPRRRASSPGAGAAA